MKEKPIIVDEETHQKIKEQAKKEGVFVKKLVKDMIDKRVEGK